MKKRNCEICFISRLIDHHNWVRRRIRIKAVDIHGMPVDHEWERTNWRASPLTSMQIDGKYEFSIIFIGNKVKGTN